eukprot:174706_1
MILTAKRMYLRNHYKDDTCSLKCEYDPCDALNKVKSSKHSLNALSESERAHMAFYHRNIFDKHRRHRHRSTRYGYKTLSNDDLNHESKKDDSDISDANELKEDDSIDEAVPSAPIRMNDTNESKEDDSIDEALPSAPIRIKYTKTVHYQKLYVKKRKNKAPDKDVIQFGYEFTTKHAKFKNPKHEVLRI